MLLYEYKPNKSVDFFLFDPSKQSLLDWRKHFEIIEGIVKRVLHLNRDSRLRKIPHDLKASNIFLNMQWKVFFYKDSLQLCGIADRDCEWSEEYSLTLIRTHEPHWICIISLESD